MNGTPKNWNLVLDWVISDGSTKSSQELSHIRCFKDKTIGRVMNGIPMKLNWN